MLLALYLIQLAKPQINEFDAYMQKLLHGRAKTSHFIVYILLLSLGILVTLFGALLYMSQSGYTTEGEREIIIGINVIGAMFCIVGGSMTYFSLRGISLKLR